MISIIIPTFNGKNKLEKLLRSLELQSNKNFEIIIVVDGSTDGTIGLKANNWDLNIKWIEETNNGRAGARNRGAWEAKDGLFIFLDDDMVMESNALAKHIQHHIKNANTVLVGNQIRDTREASSEIEKFKAYLDRKWYSQFPEYGVQLKNEEPFITAANFSVSSKLFADLGGFDPKLLDHEDRDLAIRATKKGFKIYIDKSIYGWHMDDLSFRSYIKRRKEYAKRLPDRSSMKEPNLLENIFANDSILKLAENNFFRPWPRNLKFKIYTYLIWGYARNKKQKIFW